MLSEITVPRLCLGEKRASKRKRDREIKREQTERRRRVSAAMHSEAAVVSTTVFVDRISVRETVPGVSAARYLARYTVLRQERDFCGGNGTGRLLSAGVLTRSSFSPGAERMVGNDGNDNAGEYPFRDGGEIQTIGEVARNSSVHMCSEKCRLTVGSNAR